MTHGKKLENMLIVCSATLSDCILILLGIGGLSYFVGENGIVVAILYGVSTVFLICCGWNLWFRDVSHVMNAKEKTEISLRKRCVFVFLISLFNPQAIFDTVMVIGVTSLSYEPFGDKVLFTSVCMLTSLFFFSMLVVVGKIINKNLTTDKYKIIDRFSAVLMWGFGINTLGKCVKNILALLG